MLTKHLFSILLLAFVNVALAKHKHSNTGPICGGKPHISTCTRNTDLVST
jgi:hypothetical protein